MSAVRADRDRRGLAVLGAQGGRMHAPFRGRARTIDKQAARSEARGRGKADQAHHAPHPRPGS